MCLCGGVVCVCGGCQQKAEESVGAPTAEVTGNFEPPDIVARYQALVIWKSSKCILVLGVILSGIVPF